MTAPRLDVTLAAGRPPVVVAPAADGDPAGWLARHRDALGAVVLEHGAVLVRGLGVRDVAAAAAASRAVAGPLAPEREAFARRVRHEPGVYSSSVWPANQPMCMHHESSYSAEFPGVLVLTCLVAPLRGGATALADGAAVLRDLPTDLVARFERVGWRLVRTHDDLVGAPWQEAFGTGDAGEVERYCAAQGIEWSWRPDGALRTSRRRPAVVTHPVSGVRVWFNQIAFLSEWTMEPEVREYLTLALGADGLPFNTAYGDGEPLDERTVALVNAVYDAHTVREPWEAGDVLVVDNRRTAHSREVYDGPREVVVATGSATRLADCVTRS